MQDAARWVGRERIHDLSCGAIDDYDGESHSLFVSASPVGSPVGSV